MAFLSNNKVIGELHGFFRRHWQRALQVREKFRFSEEAFHLVLAGGVGVIGGLAQHVGLLRRHVGRRCRGSNDDGGDEP